jgi:D-ribose pyranose/furanose isomerase RbsD
MNSYISSDLLPYIQVRVNLRVWETVASFCRVEENAKREANVKKAAMRTEIFQLSSKQHSIISKPYLVKAG